MRKDHRQGELRAVIDETIGLFHRLRFVAAEIYGEEGRSEARRGILRGLARFGAQTVPALARARSVTRQHVQEVVDGLGKEGLIEFLDNPAHRRSRLVSITPKGIRAVKKMDETDLRVLAAVGANVTTADLAVTAATLKSVRQRFENHARWRRAIE